MLVLSRKVGEGILIGDDARLVVISVRGNRVRLGIEAPEGIRVLRQEVKIREDRESCEGTSILTNQE